MEYKSWRNKMKKFSTTIKQKYWDLKMIDVEKFGYNEVSVYPIGTMGKHLGSQYDGFGISSNPKLLHFKSYLIPYTEGT